MYSPSPRGSSSASSMGPSLCILLCLGLRLAQSWMVRDSDHSAPAALGPFPSAPSQAGGSLGAPGSASLPTVSSRPDLVIEPSALVQRGWQVFLSCSAPVQAELYRLQKEGQPLILEERSTNDLFLRNQANFLLEDVSAASAGLYTCRFLRDGLWSKPSLPVELVVTGLYPRPYFWAEPREVMQEGQSLTLLCRSHLDFRGFAVARERSAYLRRRSNSSLMRFRIPAATKVYEGTYHCYAYSTLHPYLWSYPSKALSLEVTANSSVLLSLTQLSLAGLSLLFLGRLVAKALFKWWNRRKQLGPVEAPA
ncbi:platelet glycoprotein VI-like [Dromiciops gliroides]|uniref:platelet glycoprotein VI-like n=1 Tax=Dromiciops gliroides TaxID=33562 RepID=UPI001CC45D09|nr:platelet glycoprotein VI-like [Dromiciops gliroides]